MSEVQAEEWTTLALKPVLLLVFGILHVVYHVVLLCADAWRRLHGRTADEPPDSSWPRVLEHYGLSEQDVKVPQHLAAVLVDTPPSPVRLALYSLLRGSRKAVAQFQRARHDAVQLKHAHDAATLVHLSRISGVQQLTIYTPEPLTTIPQLQRILLDRFGTKTIAHEARDVRHDTSKQSRSSSPSSSPASSDTEASASSTLASSYTVDAHAVDLYMGHAGVDNGRLRVVLLSGTDNFASHARSYIAQRGHEYLARIQPDMAEGSTSTLRRKWEPTRAATVSTLTVERLDHHLLEHGYVDEPQLLIVYGGDVRCRQLHGIPAWPMRVTDLFFDAHMQPHLVYSWRDYVPALRKHASAQQRYGR